MRQRYLHYILLAAVVILGGCQSAIEPTAVTVKSRLDLRLVDKASQPVPGAAELIMNNPETGLSPNEVDQTTGRFAWNLEVPITGQSMTVRATPQPLLSITKYTPVFIVDTFIMPCRDTLVTLQFDRRDSIPCGMQFEDTVDLGLLCVDRDTSVSFTFGPFIASCDGTVTSATIIPPITGLTATVSPSAGSTWKAGSNLTVTVSYSTATNHNLVDFSATSVTIDASPAGKLIFHLKGSGIECKQCDCPNFDSVSYGLDISGDRGVVGADTAEVDINDAPQITTIPLTTIANNNDEGCDLLVSVLHSAKPFTHSELSLVSFNGKSGATTATVTSHTSLSEMQVRITPKVVGHFRDTLFLKIQKRSNKGEISECDTVPVYYNWYIGQGLCSVTCPPSTVSDTSICLDSTLANCIGNDNERLLFCIKNIGDGKLRTSFRLPTDPQFVVRFDTVGPIYTGQTFTLLPGQSECFSVHFIPDINRVNTFPKTTDFSSSIILCGDKYPLHGVAFTQCINCIPSSIYTFGVTQTLNAGFYFPGPGQILFTSKPGETPDLYAENVDATHVNFVSASGTMFKLVQSNFTISQSGRSLCDDPVPVSACPNCTSLPGAGSSSISVNVNDLIIFKTAAGQCGLIYVTNLILTNGLWHADFQATFPICE